MNNSSAGGSSHAQTQYTQLSTHTHDHIDTTSAPHTTPNIGTEELDLTQIFRNLHSNHLASTNNNILTTQYFRYTELPDTANAHTRQAAGVIRNSDKVKLMAVTTPQSGVVLGAHKTSNNSSNTRYNVNYSTTFAVTPDVNNIGSSSSSSSSSNSGNVYRDRLYQNSITHQAITSVTARAQPINNHDNNTPHRADYTAVSTAAVDEEQEENTTRISNINRTNSGRLRISSNTVSPSYDQ